MELLLFLHLSNCPLGHAFDLIITKSYSLLKSIISNIPHSDHYLLYFKSTSSSSPSPALTQPSLPGFLMHWFWNLSLSLLCLRPQLRSHVNNVLYPHLQCSCPCSLYYHLLSFTQPNRNRFIQPGWTALAQLNKFKKNIQPYQLTLISDQQLKWAGMLSDVHNYGALTHCLPLLDGYIMQSRL